MGAGRAPDVFAGPPPFLPWCLSTRHRPREVRAMRVTTGRNKPHPHDDAPDTADAFRRLATLPPGPQRDALR